jgi:hypothetical protein
MSEAGFKFVGTQLFDAETSSNEDRQSYQLVLIFTQRLVPDYYYSFITVKKQAPNLKTSLFHALTAHQISNKIFLF